jgi:hypothetical protein
MVLKRKNRVSKRNRKTSRRNKTHRNKTHRNKTHRNKTHRNKTRSMRGGNYEKDVTTQTYLRFPMKQSNEVVTSVPGRGVMSVSAFKRLMEDEERNGFRFYD